MLFKNETRVSRTDIVDVLCEEAIYSEQSFADNWLDDVWTELERRLKLLDGAAPFAVAPRVVTRTKTWDQVPAYAFCVLAPLLQSSTRWRPRGTKARIAKHYALQGALFERISDEALRGAGWQTYLTGWSRMQAASLPAVVATVAQRVGEPERSNWATNVAPKANEAGLDLVLFREFNDGRCGFPIYLVQCAAGDNWDTKLHTPVLSVWNELVDFAAPPHKAFTIPHSLSDEDLRHVTVRVAGMVLDRYRLHDTSRPQNWCSSALATDIKAFLRPLIRKLPSYA